MKHRLFLPRVLVAALLAAPAVVSPALAGPCTPQMGGMTGPAPLTAAALRTTAAGTDAVIVVAIESRTRGDRWRARVLDRISSTEYRRTTTDIELDVPDTTPVVMGKLDELRGGSVVQVQATVGARGRSLDARKLVMLTPFVRVHD
jgi:hypothetical protein